MSKKVYLIRAGQFYKIGISGNANKRLQQIQTGCPIKCTYIGYFPSDNPEVFERQLHTMFSDTMTYGEWFELGDDHIKRMIVELNLKYVESPYLGTTKENIEISSCQELKEARINISESEEFISVFKSMFDGYCISVKERRVINSVIKEYGLDICIESLYHCIDNYKVQDIIQNIGRVCQSYIRYGRFVSKRAWRCYFIFRESHGKDDAAKFLEYVMINNLDENDNFFKWINSCNSHGYITIESPIEDYIKISEGINFKNGKTIH